MIKLLISIALLLLGNEILSLAVISVWACIGLGKLLHAMVESGVLD